MTISAEMSDDVAFLGKLKSQEYNLAVLHYAPDDPDIYAKKCGHEDLFISLTPGDPLTFYPEIHLKDLDGKSILLFSRIGFWAHFHADKTPNTKYLLQIDRSSFQELTIHSEFPSFSSSYFLNRGELREGKVHIPIVDPECHTDYYLCCLDAEKSKYQALFSQVHDDTIR